jgi:hypothetical protein
MTTRNFRVHNGISVGDITISASANTITGLSTSAPSADGDVANKKYVDDSLAGLSQNSISQLDTSVTVTDSGSNGLITLTADSNVELTVNNSGMQLGNANARVNSILDEDNLVSDSATALATQQSIKAYVDSKASITTDSNATNVTLSGTGASGQISLTANSNEEMLINDDGVIIRGNLTVEGTETIVSTQNLQIEDAIIGLNSNVSNKNNMPRFSGLHLHRGTGSAALDQDLYFVWDDAFADDGTSIYGNSGGAFTAFRSTHNEGSETPNDDFDLVDMRCNVLHATATAAQYADIGERFEADAPMTAGAVVELGGNAEITESTSDMSEAVFGVVSQQPAFMMNSAAGNDDSHPFIAMTGRTPVRVTGAVAKGQRLVTSSVKGCARAVASGESINPFHVIGRALETSTDEGIKLVNCVVRTNN